MKKVIVFLVIIALSFMLSPLSQAYAATSTPHIVVSGEVWLLGESGNKLFMLPDTYYARINNLDEAYYFITFNGVSGKVSKNVVSTTGYHATATGSTTELQVSADYLEFVSINLKAEPSLASENVVALPVADSFTFLGEYPTNEAIWYYVKYNQYFGYIRSERTNMPDIEIAAFVPETLPEPTVDEPPDDSKSVSDLLNGLEGGAVRVIVIVALAVPALILIFILFRPRRGKREKYYED